jgi:8-oxo-dGTP pyrophosphatase MutT (NUDIX family)
MTLRQRLEGLSQRTPYQFPAEGIPADFRKAAVLILIWEEQGVPHTLLTLRASHLSSFANQMCFPGGRLDADETFEQAALRETHEEVDIPPQHVEIVGRLDDAWSGGRYLMVPYVGFLQQPPSPTANEEVAKIINLPIDDSMVIEDVEVTAGNVTYREHRVRCEDQSVTGLTADLLLEAVEMLRDHNSGRGATRYHYLLKYEANRDSGNP